MDEFFTSRLGIYDEHMLSECEGVAEGYIELARHVPSETQALLDLGCGTGLELEEIFKVCPHVRVTGIDLTQAMLNSLHEKYSDRRVDLICANYLTYDFGLEVYDTAVSFETMHHLTHDEKLALYVNILRALKPGGRYIEGDYMAATQEEEDFCFAEYFRIRSGQNAARNEIYHYDTPCTVENQIKLLLRAGFASAEKVWNKGATTIIIAKALGRRAFADGFHLRR